eukprot:Platyproteum_vivax@DN420_c0_g1_i2.p1
MLNAFDLIPKPIFSTSPSVFISNYLTRNREKMEKYICSICQDIEIAEFENLTNSYLGHDREFLRLHLNSLEQTQEVVSRLHLANYNERPLFCYPTKQVSTLLITFRDPVYSSQIDKNELKSELAKEVESVGGSANMVAEVDLVELPCDPGSHRTEIHFAYLHLESSEMAVQARNELKDGFRFTIARLEEGGPRGVDVTGHAEHCEPFFHAGVHYGSCSRAIYVDKLPPDTSSSTLYSMFKKYGRIEWCRTKRRGLFAYGWVWYKSFAEAANAQDHMDGHVIEYFQLRVTNVEADPELRGRVDEDCIAHGDASGEFPTGPG